MGGVEVDKEGTKLNICNSVDNKNKEQNLSIQHNTIIIIIQVLFFLSVAKNMIDDFRERKGGRKRGREILI